jgi:hypothetical protein
MSFKRPRPLSYGVHRGQKLVTNGIAQESPLDRKSLPLEKQKKVVLAVSSDDRELAQPDSKGEESSASDCVINLKQPIKGVYGYRMLEFSFFNRFFSVQEKLNDVLTFSDGTTTFTAKIPEGYYTFSSDPADWINPVMDAKSVSLEDLNSVDSTVYTAMKTYFPLDIRIALYAALKDPAVVSDTVVIDTDRKTDRLKITFGTNSYTLDPDNSTALGVLGLPRRLEGKEWQGTSPPNVEGPANIAIQSSLLNNNELIDPKGENDTFAVIAVHADEGFKQLYMPTHPPFVNFNSQIMINRVPFKMIEPQSKQVIKSNNIEWSMLLEFFTVDAGAIN